MTRYYPHGELFAHVIGYVGRINDKELKEIDKDLYAGSNLIGKIGVEKYYEDLLHGVPGNESVEADAFGNVLRQGRKERYAVMICIYHWIMVYKPLPLNNWPVVVVLLSRLTHVQVKFWRWFPVQVLTLIYLSPGLVAKTIRSS